MNNILLVCPKFRGYEKVIKNSILKNKIGRVDGFFYDEREAFNISFFSKFHNFNPYSFLINHKN